MRGADKREEKGTEEKRGGRAFPNFLCYNLTTECRIPSRADRADEVAMEQSLAAAAAAASQSGRAG